MEIVFAAFVASLVTWLVVRSNYRGHIQDLRDAVTYERKRRMQEEERRMQEEDRAETLSDALFGRASTQQRRDTGMQN